MTVKEVDDFFPNAPRQCQSAGPARKTPPENLSARHNPASAKLAEHGEWHCGAGLGKDDQKEPRDDA
jgi:hypothetical protein